ncbi:MAG: DUF1800 domain-containing protein, partial [Acidimicrobiia bacterium]|nr:DUF1800 domain-containing protein [Acidimicrobiia bacterium]
MTDTTAGKVTAASTETGPELVEVTLPQRNDGSMAPVSDAAPPDDDAASTQAGGSETPGLPQTGNDATPAAPPPAAPAQAAPATTATTAPPPAAPATSAPTAPAAMAPATAAPAPAPAPAAPAPPLPAPPTTVPPTTAAPMTAASIAVAPTTAAPTTVAPTTTAPATTVGPPTTAPPTTAAATTAPPTTAPATTAAPTTAAPTTAPPTTNPSVPPPPTTNASAIHLANRLTFGATPALMQQISQLGPAGFVEDQLARTGPDPSVENRLGSFRLLGMTRKATYDRLRDLDSIDLRRELTHLNVLRATFSENQLYEMMCQLWLDHFNIHLLGNGRTEHLHIDYQENVIRPNAMGSFRDLLVATANSTAMLTYLDNDRSNANSNQGVNENYGRELLELHTLGIDENDNQVYTEVDVRNAALAMSGWSMEFDRNDGNYSDFVFRNDYHHTGEVSILNGAWTSAGTSGKGTGDSLVNFLATHPSTARYVAYKICRRFVADSPPTSLVDSTAQVYLANDTALAPTLRHILTSAEFASSEGQKLRRPFEVMVATLRALHSEIPNDPDGNSADQLLDRLGQQNHEPWAWDAPNGYPDEASHWLNADGMIARWNLGVRLARDIETGGDGDRIRTDYSAI